jgi:N-acetylmuramic acid 6-phosphate etherase
VKKNSITLSGTTESASNHNNLEQKSIAQLLNAMNEEDKSVPLAVEKALPQIEALVEAAQSRMARGGRVFYIGAGTSGRLGILDASEIPPTYGAPASWFVGLIAGGDHAIRNAVEFAEDDPTQAWKDLAPYDVNENDILIGIAASGRTPYVIGGLETARQQGLLTGAIVCNDASAVAAVAEFPIEVIVGPEFVTGSTRMKSGTATKLVLNMISTALMILKGRVKGNKMVDMQLANKKLIARGQRMIMEELKVSQPVAAQLLEKYGSVRKAIDNYKG